MKYTYNGLPTITTTLYTIILLLSTKSFTNFSCRPAGILARDLNPSAAKKKGTSLWSSPFQDKGNYEIKLNLPLLVISVVDN